MTRRQFRMFSLITVLSAMLLLAGCSKKVAKATPPSPPAPPTPTATLAASPDVLQQGQWTTLTWHTTNANDIAIAGLGALPASGSRSVDPSMSTTYMLVAKGPGGTQDASARVTVNAKPVANMTTQPSEADLFAKNVKDVFFDFNKALVRPDEVPVADNDAQFLAQHPDIKIMLEGHCDDRGSEEYNLALGDSRAHSLKQSLEQQGVSADRIQTISYGKEKPFCTTDDEQCWQANRRDHLTFGH
ncbi:MAG: peptidoglycan-associated lipoprotein Pal [Candidatus Sulfotelmatobacter sp.]